MKQVCITIVIAGSLLSGFCKAVQDTLDHHYQSSVFEPLSANYWNPEISWKNKYRDWDAGDQRAAFIGATTILVSLTDAWHLFDLAAVVCLIAAALSAGWLVSLSNRPGRAWFLWAAVVLIARLAVFNIFYHFVFV